MDDSRCAADLAPVMNAVGMLLDGRPDASAGKSAAARLRRFVSEKGTDWAGLGDDLQEIIESRRPADEKKAEENAEKNDIAPDTQKK